MFAMRQNQRRSELNLSEGNADAKEGRTMAQPMEDKTPVAGGELQEALKELDGWVISITKRFRFEKWGDITRFMQHLADTIAATNHHPDVTLDTGSKSVIVTVTTHSERTVTKADLEFAKRLNEFKPSE
jgi:pterin-4a-carbinolamine dehydratase